MELYPLYVITPARTLFISGLKFRVLKLAEFAWQLSRYLRRGSVNFKINSRPLFTVIFKLKNDNFKTRDFSPLIERVLNSWCGSEIPKTNYLITFFSYLPKRNFILRTVLFFRSSWNFLVTCFEVD